MRFRPGGAIFDPSLSDGAMRDLFREFAHRVSAAVGSPWAFLIAAAVTIAWAISGPFFGFSDTWQLVINTGTTVVTFLVVFIIQNTQNRDATAIHLKLDELIRAIRGARTNLIELEKLSDGDLQSLQQEFHRLHEHFARRADEVSKEHARRHSRRHKGGRQGH
jgi:low affinity Fe/Cu permease